jgi:hypothetical protein
MTIKENKQNQATTANLPAIMTRLLEENGAPQIAKTMAMLNEREIKELLEVLQFQMQQALLEMAVKVLARDNEIKSLKTQLAETKE